MSTVIPPIYSNVAWTLNEEQAEGFTQGVSSFKYYGDFNQARSADQAYFDCDIVAEHLLELEAGGFAVVLISYSEIEKVAGSYCVNLYVRHLKTVKGTWELEEDDDVRDLLAVLHEGDEL